MTRRSGRGRALLVTLVAVVAAVALSGCNGVLGGPAGGGSETDAVDGLTPVPVTDTDGPTLRTAAGSAATPPGVFPNGTVRAAALAAAHERGLADRSYTWTYRVRREGTVAGVAPDLTLVRVRTTADRTVFVVEQPDDDWTPDRTLYVENGTGYLGSLSGADPRVLVTDDPGTPERYVGAGEAIGRFLSGPGFDVAVVERHGRRFYRLYRRNGSLPAELAGGATNGSNVTATAYVTPAGVVRTLAVEYERPGAGPRDRVSLRFDYAAVGETAVERPAWVGNGTGPPASPGA